MTQTAAEQTRRPCEGVGSELPRVAKTAGEPRLFRLNCRGDHQFAILVPESRRTATHGLDIERKSLSDRSLFLQGNGVNTVGPSSASGPYAELAGTRHQPTRNPLPVVLLLDPPSKDWAGRPFTSIQTRHAFLTMDLGVKGSRCFPVPNDLLPRHETQHVDIQLLPVEEDL